MTLELVVTPQEEEVIEDTQDATEEIEPEEEVIPETEDAQPITVDDIVSGKVPEKGVDKTPKWAKDRFAELTAKIYEKDRRIQELEEGRSTVVGERPIPPVEADFADSQEFREARMKYEDSLETWNYQQREFKRSQQIREESAAEAISTFTKNAERMRKKYPDFDDVINEPVFTPVMQHEIRGSEFGPEIGYYLAKNPDEAFRLSKLSPTALAKEVGKYEVQFSAATKRIISGAPRPILPLKGDDIVKKDPSKMNDDEWYQYDLQQKKKKLQSGGKT
jgi:gas vesicle protein